MKKIALFAFNGELMCFVHVLLNAIDMNDRRYEVKIIIEGSATKLVPELAQPENPMHRLYEKAKGLDLTILDSINDHGEFHLLHICKDQIRLPLYADYPGHAVNWAVTKNDLGLKHGRDLFKRTVVGGMDDRGVIVDGSPEGIRGAVGQLIAEVGTEGFILGADSTVPTDIPVSNIRMAVEATAN